MLSGWSNKVPTYIFPNCEIEMFVNFLQKSNKKKESLRKSLKARGLILAIYNHIYTPVKNRLAYPL